MCVDVLFFIFTTLYFQVVSREVQCTLSVLLHSVFRLFFFFFLIQSRHLGRAINKADQRVSELQVLIEELQWDMEKIRRRENRLNAHLIEILERVRMCSLPVSLCFTRPIFCLHESQLWHLPESLSGEQQRLQSVWGGQQCLWDHHHQQKKGGN